MIGNGIIPVWLIAMYALAAAFYLLGGACAAMAGLMSLQDQTHTRGWKRNRNKPIGPPPDIEP